MPLENASQREVINDTSSLWLPLPWLVFAATRYNRQHRLLRLLHRNEQRVVEGIVVELGHRAEIFLEPLGFKKLLDALFQLVRDFADLLCIFVFSHFKPPFRICFGEKKTPSGICSVNEPLPLTGFLCASADDERCYPPSPIQSVCQTAPGVL